MERRFRCTGCGKCCQGRLPLSVPDALAHADRFPLFVLWAPVRPGGRSYDLTRQLGVTLDLKKKKQAALRVAILSYVPSGMKCPALQDDGLCAVHDAKPLRCRAMPLSGARAEDDQDDLLLPRAGWECDVGEDAPVVYRDKTVVARGDYEAEREQLIKDAAILRPFATMMLQAAPQIRMDVEKMASRPMGGHVITDTAHLIQHLAGVDAFHFAAKQLPVMEAFAARTAGVAELAKEHKRYADSAAHWRRVLGG
ncbi:MAG: YkgJ family cysteine cluster protein [Alphaproteobacteria bacterium]|nr:YkgJ family cysteine cluster protein [Alphaproteobacteria bacterium]